MPTAAISLPSAESATDRRPTSTSNSQACAVPGGMRGGAGGGLGFVILAMRLASAPCSSITVVMLLTAITTPRMAKQQNAGMPYCSKDPRSFCMTSAFPPERASAKRPPVASSSLLNSGANAADERGPVRCMTSDGRAPGMPRACVRDVPGGGSARRAIENPVYSLRAQHGVIKFIINQNALHSPHFLAPTEALGA